MANVLNEFLYGVSKGFQDAAFASFSRRRSTVRADIAQSFASSAPDTTAPEIKKSEYLDMLNVPAATGASSKAAQQGVVDVAPRRRGRPAKVKRGRPKGGSKDVGLREI